MIPEEENEASCSSKVEKQPKRGIIYLSSIPPYMNVTQIREYFSEFGVLGRVFLQLQDTGVPKGQKEKKKKKVSRKFSEGWIEFEKKSVAKKVAQMLNNTQVSTRKKSKQYDFLWSIKYLSGFKWTHLHERLAYEKASRRQKLRAEIQLAKKNATFFTSNLSKKSKDDETVSINPLNKDEPEIEGSTKVDELDKRKEFLGSLFS